MICINEFSAKVEPLAGECMKMPVTNELCRNTEQYFINLFKQYELENFTEIEVQESVKKYGEYVYSKCDSFKSDSKNKLTCEKVSKMYKDQFRLVSKDFEVSKVIKSFELIRKPFKSCTFPTKRKRIAKKDVVIEDLGGEIDYNSCKTKIDSIENAKFQFEKKNAQELVKIVGYRKTNYSSLVVTEIYCEWSNAGIIQHSWTSINYLRKRYPTYHINIGTIKQLHSNENQDKFFIEGFLGLLVKKGRVFVKVKWLFYSSYFNELCDLSHLLTDVPVYIEKYFIFLETVENREEKQGVVEKEVLELYKSLKQNYKNLKEEHIITLITLHLKCFKGVVNYILSKCQQTI